MVSTYTALSLDQRTLERISVRNIIYKINFEKVYYVLSILLAFAAPLSWKLSRVILVLIMATKVLHFDFKIFFYKIIHSKFLIALLLFILYQFLTLLWTETSYQDGHTFIRSYLLWLAIPILATTLNMVKIRHIITIFLFAMAISEVVAYGMYFGFWTIDGHGAEYPSPFMHHTAYSIFMAFTAIILLNRLYSTIYTVKEKIIMGIFFITVSGNLFISQGRIGQLAFAIAIFVAGLLHFKLKLKTLFISILLIGSIFTLAYNTSTMFQQRVAMGISDIEKIKNGNLSSSWGTRVAYIILSADIIKDHPLFGVGLEDTKAVGLEYIQDNPYNFPPEVINFMKRSHHFHNQYLMTTLQGGLVALILFLFMFYYLLILPIEDPELKRLSILFTSIFLVAFISDPLMMYEQTRALFILFVSLFTAASISNGIKED